MTRHYLARPFARCVASLAPLAALLASGACKGSHATESSAGSAAVAPAVEVGSATGSAGSGAASGSSGDPMDQTVGAPGTQDLAGLSNVLEQVKREAQLRTPVAISVEKVFAALGSAGVDVKSVKQVLAYNVGASYCALSKSVSAAGGTRGIVVCEYPSAKVAAEANAALIAKPPLAGVLVARSVNDTTTIAVINDTSGELKTKVFDTFLALK